MAYTVLTRKELWLSLARLNSHIHDRWCVLGDFNAMLSFDDRFQGRPVTTYETQDFSGCLQATDLLELRSCGHFYSWNNKSQGEARVLSRIDRCNLVNSPWLMQYAGVVVEILNPGLSDHSPLLLKCANS